MKVSKTFQGLLLGVSLLLAASALAANKASVQLPEPAMVGGTQLKAGDYTVKWDGSGPSVQLSILRGNKVVATTPAQVVSVDRAPERSSVLARQEGNGSASLAEIRFSGKKYVLRIGGEAGGADAGGGGGNSNQSVR
jgi:hypothetical protein